MEEEKKPNYSWKDTNLALFGSDTEKEVKKEAAELEPAWQKTGKKAGIQIWRIEMFEVKEWPKEEYGKFFNGDSYIILNTYTKAESESFFYDIHFWIGRLSTQDEYTTAANKTVELHTYLDLLPILHREVEGHESDLFKSYFSEITIMRGGIDSGFRQVLPEAYKPRLFHIRYENALMSVQQVGLKRNHLNSEDTFILDLGIKIYHLIGKKSNKEEKFKGAQYLHALKAERKGVAQTETVEEDDWPSLGEMTILDGDEIGVKKPRQKKFIHKVFRLKERDESAVLDWDFISEGRVLKEKFDGGDVYVADSGNHLFIWVGLGASIAERINSLSYAHNYLSASEHPLIPISVEMEGKESALFKKSWVMLH